jgi:RsiW-degrading membrane proteinase PrsW (M82 family)
VRRRQGGEKSLSPCGRGFAAQHSCAATRIEAAGKLRQLIASKGTCRDGTNTLYLVIGALAVAVAVLGYQLYQDRHQPEGVHIQCRAGRLVIQGK